MPLILTYASMEENPNDDVEFPEVDVFTWVGSSIGNAYFSGVNFHQLWMAVCLSSNPEELDAAISAIETINRIRYCSRECGGH